MKIGCPEPSVPEFKSCGQQLQLASPHQLSSTMLGLPIIVKLTLVCTLLSKCLGVLAPPPVHSPDDLLLTGQCWECFERSGHLWEGPFPNSMILTWEDDEYPCRKLSLDERCNQKVKLKQYYCSLCGRYAHFNLGGCSVHRPVTRYLAGDPPELEVPLPGDPPESQVKILPALLP
ncbi:uncharacterized protein PGTG_07572 [Puccinia graminis f. sp. tritici CRL 75-36-700-3]|uniref:Uncharacterized protein n=2 Tax=Puccinia graminis f. sp. tritici TaxID=56615 RepID=E3KCM3_PUCGT|nr:uncharacterized protein PGTG_07572 [Puccinia graminis f. sp. tritici CRL 75-36-700-3]EFP82175.1 hypothetical protein PGTG_07572 [Puccinia graminis f. sp. tritici CRL 75-36-700-3]